MASLERLREGVLDELNVKALHPLTDPGEVVSFDIRPNLPQLGPKYGKRLGAIRAGLAKLDPASVARAVTEGGRISIPLPDGAVELMPDEILVDLLKREASPRRRATGCWWCSTRPSPRNCSGKAGARLRPRRPGLPQERRLRVEDRIAIEATGDPEAIEAIEPPGERGWRETLALAWPHRDVRMATR
jgi:isoleucyl-tRNA synthetase